MPNKLVFHLLWSYWRHLPIACEIAKDIAVLSRNSSSLCHPRWLREVFQSPGLKHMLQVSVWVFIFPRTLFPSCYLVSVPLFVCELSNTKEFFLKG